jgi:hypothetical protein
MHALMRMTPIAAKDSITSQGGTGASVSMVA